MTTHDKKSETDYDGFVEQFIFGTEGAEPAPPTTACEPPEKKVIEDFDTTIKRLSAGDLLQADEVTKKYSELFGWDKTTLAEFDDFDVVVYNVSKWDSDEQTLIPDPADFEGRVIDHTAMYPFVLSMQPQMAGMKVMLVGPTGSGKSTLAEYYCAVVNQPFVRINGRQDMESDDILGRAWVSDKGMEFLVGVWPRATQKGHFVLVDEPWKMPSGIWMTAQRHMERGGIWQLDGIPSEDVLDRQITPKSSYRCVLADNVVGTGDNVEQYGATMIQDGSTLNRIDLVIPVPYLQPAQEIGIITGKYPAIPEHMAARMVSMLNLLRGGYNSNELSSPASIRNIESWCDVVYQTNGNYADAFKWVLLNRYADDAELGAVRKHYYTCFGKQLN